MHRAFSLNVNGHDRSTTTDADRPLLDVIREDFHLTGTKYGCGEGECGACMVLVEGVPTRSCITSIAEVQGKPVLTIEGVAEGSAGGRLHAVQQAFLDKQGIQCGYCVPGHIMTAVAFARDNPGASREEIVSALSGHICRCCNYPNILAAVTQAVGSHEPMQ
jgi:aerobic-type carbon monoxide dehydrogenase small subunit (CoxS/CutS family)